MLKVICVIGHGINLIPHYIQHYLQLDVDEINFVVYSSDLYPNLYDEVKRAIGDRIEVKIIGNVYHRVFDWEKVTDLYNHYTNYFLNDWWIVADIDEFHLYSMSLRSIIKDCYNNGWEIVRGGFVDRIGAKGEFPEINGEEDLFDQFPMAGFFRFPMSGACPNKICIKKGYIQITPGQHYATINGHTTWRWQGWNHPLIAPIAKYSVQVHHFKWDSTCLKRMRLVAEIEKDYSFSDEYKIMYETIKRKGSKIDLEVKDFMFQYGCWRFKDYEKWNTLIKKIISI